VFCYIQVHFKAGLTVNLALALNLCEYLIKLKTNTNVGMLETNTICLQNTNSFDI
jgi:hypothetical protein